jgi:hypothetical protein
MLSSSPVLRLGLAVPPDRGEILRQKRRDGTWMVNSASEYSEGWRVGTRLSVINRGELIWQTGRTVEGRRGYGEGG